MTSALNPNQQVILEHAVQHSGGKIVWFPEHIKGGARAKVLEALFKRALITPDGDDWVVAAEGYDALGRPRPGALPPTITLDDPELDDEISRICVDVLRTEKDRHRRSVGSLGGGNHFIEIAQGTEDAFLCIHSGSRNFGLKIAERYQKIAVATCPDAYLKERKKGLCYLQGEDTLNYMRDMKVAQRFAALNRRVMLHELLDDAADLEIFDTVHNYIAEDNVIRKGAVRAGLGEKLIVPLNMRDGSVICIGRGNEEFNSSSPHGAGRSMSRKKAKANLSLEEFEASMQGIFSTCVSRATLDEAPMAYKDGESVLGNIHETAEIVERIRPVYNFKAPE